MNPFDPSFIAALITLGLSVGFFAGLLGIGGGGIMVPMLSTIFIWQGVAPENTVHLALGTSMASIIATAFSSARAHHKKNAIEWPAVKAMTPGIILGAFSGSYLVSMLPSLFLALFFSGFMVIVAINMLAGIQSRSEQALPSARLLGGIGAGIGAISSMVSIGGGTLSVPFLYWHKVPMHRAIGTSAAIGFPIAVCGTLGYAWYGSAGSNIPYTFGFIYWPAVLLISLISFLTAPLGVAMAHRLPVAILKKAFALVLLALCAKMLWAVFLH